MKIINLNESQFTRLFNEGIDNYGGNNLPEYLDQTQTWTASEMDEPDGEKRLSKPVRADDVQDKLTNQNGFSPMRSSRTV